MKTSPSCRCCRCEICRIYFDEFGRPDSSNIGDDWNEVDGDWEIENGELVTEDSDALAILDIDHPNSIPSHVVMVDIKGENPGDKLLVLIAVESDDTYLLARATIEDGATCGTVDLISVSGGSPDVLYTAIVPELVPDEWHTLKVCYHRDDDDYAGTLAVRITTASGIVRSFAVSADSDGLRVGLGTGSISTKAHFDNFCWQRHKTTDGDAYTPAEPHCPDCNSASCLISADDFDRADSTDIGCQWHEHVGDWEISSNSLSIAESPAYVRHTAPHGQLGNKMIASVKAKAAAVGDKARLTLGMADQNYFTSVELEFGDDCGWMRIFKRSGGSESQIGVDVRVAGLTAGEWHGVSLCYGSGMFHGELIETLLVAAVDPANSEPRYYAVDVTVDNNPWAGLGAEVVTSEVLFDDFEVRYSNDDLHPNCTQCGTPVGCSWGGTVNQCEWEEVDGSWSDFSTTDSDALLQFLVPHPFNDTHHHLEGTFRATASGGQAIVYIAFKDASTYLAARVTVGDCGMIELIKDGSVLDTLHLEPLAIDVDHYLCASFDGEILRADLAPNTTSPDDAPNNIYRHAAVATSADSDGIYCALGTGDNGGSISFSFGARTAYSSRYPDCSTCDNCLLSEATNTDVADSCEWDPKSGTVNTVDGKVVISTADGYAGYKGNDGSDNGLITVSVKGNSGQKLRVYINDDATLSGPWGEAEFGVSSGTVRLSTGQSKPVGSLIGGTSHGISLCLSGTSLKMNLDESGFATAAASLTGSLSSPAVGKFAVLNLLGVDGDAEFSQFRYLRMHVPKPMALIGASSFLSCGGCQTGCSWCKDGIVPSEFLITIAGLANGAISGGLCCTNFNGDYYLPSSAQSIVGDPCPAGIELLGLSESDCNIPAVVSFSLGRRTLDPVNSRRLTVDMRIQPLPPVFPEPFPRANVLRWTALLTPDLPMDCFAFNRVELLPEEIIDFGDGIFCNFNDSRAYVTSGLI